MAIDPRTPAPKGVVYRFENYELDTGRRELRRAGALVDCEPKAYAVLEYLAERAERAVSKEELGGALWGSRWSDGALRRSIWAARRAVDDDRGQRVIRTISGYGYRFSEAVVRLPGVDDRSSLPTGDPEQATPQNPSFPAFVGRHAELAELDRRLELAIAGTPQSVWITGAAGAGKTRLLQEFAPLAARRGARVLTGSVPRRQAVPAYWLWRQLFDPLIRSRRRDQLQDELGDAGPILTELFETLRLRFPDSPAAPPLDPTRARLRLFMSVQRFVEAVSASEPLLLVLEDLHWVDFSSLLLLRFLIENFSTQRILIAVALRSGEEQLDEERSQLTAEIARLPIVHLLPLAGLNAADTARLGGLVAGEALTPEWAREITLRTEGNPFMVVELVRWLEVNGTLAVPPGGARRLPRSLRATIDLRLDRVSEGCLEVLTRAAVWGRAFDVGFVARISERSSEEILRRLDEASAVQIVEPESLGVGMFRFRHALWHEAVYERISDSDRVSLHRFAGRVLEDMYRGAPAIPLDALVHHFSRSPFGEDIAKTCDYAQRAAEEAIRLHAYPEAIELYRSAAASLERSAPSDLARHAELLHGLGLAQRGSGRHTDSIETFQRLIAEARASGDRELFARASIGLEEARYTARAPAEASIALLEEALRGLPDPPTLLRAQVLERLAAALNVARHPRRQQVSQQALDEARYVNDELARVRALSTRHIAIWGPDSLQERLDIGRELLAIGEHSNTTVDSFGIGARVWGHQTRLPDLLEIGDMHGLAGAIEGATIDIATPTSQANQDITRRIAEDTRLAVHELNMRLFRGTLLVLRGEFDAAQANIVATARDAQKLQAGNVLFGVQVQLFGLRYLQGRMAEILPIMQLAVVQNPQVRQIGHAALALLMADIGRAEDAHAEVNAIANAGIATIPRDGLFIAVLTMLTEALFLIQSGRCAAEIYDLLLPFADRNALCAASYCTGSVSRYLGELAMMLGEDAAAASHFETAISRNLSMEAAPFVAMAEYEYALLLGRQRHPTAAGRRRALIRSALATAKKLGMQHLEQRVRALEVSM